MSPLTESTRLVLKKPTGSGWTITPQQLLVDDPDALAYLAAVQTADGQALETGVRLAVNAFVKGCKADGVWPAIKASCILAGARTLNGALVPLAGTAPTNNGFVGLGTDYVRKTGLVGNGSSKYLDTNRNNNADPQNSQHVSVFISTAGSPSNATQLYLSGEASSGSLSLGIASSQQFSRNRSITFSFAGSSTATGLAALNRSSSDSYIHRLLGTNNSFNVTSQTPVNANIHVYKENVIPATNYSNARLAFYSIGESLNLALLDARVTTLINAFAAAIP
jgi:hypothetical protein